MLDIDGLVTDAPPHASVQQRLTRLDATAARRWAVLSRAALATHRRAIDALNVFPVPDGDTGTNLYLTFDSAMDAARADRDQTPTGTLIEAADALASATLLAARGNSGVILSQIVRGLAEIVTAEGGALDGPGLARALRRASDLASASVTRPAPGTILSVASGAAAAAARAAHDDGTLYAVSRAALLTAREALAGTTLQLPQLAAAGVVDAGAVGFVLLLEALDSVVSGEEVTATDRSPASPSGDRIAVGGPAGATSSATAAVVVPAACAGGGETAYELMFLLDGTTEQAVGELREVLLALGDSVVMAGSASVPRGGLERPSLWSVHAHVHDVGAAVEAAIAAGHPHQIRITSLPTDRGPDEPAHAASATVGVVAWSTGVGLGRLFTEAGAHLIEPGPGRRPSVADVLAAVESVGTTSVLVLPNDRDLGSTAEAVIEIAADRGIDVHVVRSRAAVQGIAAMAVFDSGHSSQDNLVAMTSAAAATRHGAVTVATREALTSAGWCYAGDVLGIVDDDIVTIGTDLAAVGGAVVDMLLGSGGEILTIVSGADAPDGLAASVGKAARRRRRDIDLSVLDGGQPEHHLLLGVE